MKYLLFVAIALFSSLPSCRKSENATSENSSFGDKDLVFTTMGGDESLKIISKNECELTSGGTIYLCKYEKGDAAFRVECTVAGSKQVLYFAMHPQGLLFKNTLYLSPKDYKNYCVAERLRLEAQKNNELAIAKLKMEREELKQKAALLEQERINKSTTETNIVTKFIMPPNKASKVPTLVITDVSIKFLDDRFSEPSTTTINYRDLFGYKYYEYYNSIEFSEFDGYGATRQIMLSVYDKEFCDVIVNEINKCMAIWIQKYSDTLNPIRKDTFSSMSFANNESLVTGDFKKQLIGKWKLTGEKAIAEINADGTGKLFTLTNTLIGPLEWNLKGNIVHFDITDTRTSERKTTGSDNEILLISKKAIVMRDTSNKNIDGSWIRN